MQLFPRFSTSYYSFIHLFPPTQYIYINFSSYLRGWNLGYWIQSLSVTFYSGGREWGTWGCQMIHSIKELNSCPISHVFPPIHPISVSPDLFYDSVEIGSLFTWGLSHICCRLELPLTCSLQFTFLNSLSSIHIYLIFPEIFIILIYSYSFFHCVPYYRHNKIRNKSN